jgi:hypothetical protein
MTVKRVVAEGFRRLRRKQFENTDPPVINTQFLCSSCDDLVSWWGITPCSAGVVNARKILTMCRREPVELAMCATDSDITDLSEHPEKSADGLPLVSTLVTELVGENNSHRE